MPLKTFLVGKINLPGAPKYNTTMLNSNLAQKIWGPDISEILKYVSHSNFIFTESKIIVCLRGNMCLMHYISYSLSLLLYIYLTK